MATRFAVSSGNFSNGAIWDNGSVPLSTDDIYSNGFAISVDQNISAVSLRSTLSNVYLANMNIPKMTSNTQPSGTVNASSNTTIAFQAFDQNTSTQWNPTTNATGWISFDYGTNKLIKRYYLLGAGNYPTKWTFDGWDTGTSSWVTLEDKTATVNNTLTGYLSPLLSHTTQYSMYRINVTSNSNTGFPPQILSFEMTENISASFGATTGGSFDVSVARDITLSGNASLYTGNSTTGTINITANSGTVNIVANSNELTNVSVGTGRCIYVNGTATVNVTGNCNQGTTATATVIRTNSTGIINYTGNMTSGAQGSGSSNMFEIASICTFNAIGNINGHANGSGTIAHYPILVSGNATVNITGILNSYLGYCLGSSANSTINITGAITANSTALAVNNTGVGSLNIISGIITASSSATAITSSSTGLVTVGNSPLINTNNVMAVNAQRIRLYSPASVQWQFQDNLGGTKNLYSAGGSLGLPLTTNVRNNVQYGASNELTGSMVVPVNANVRKGVQVDVQPNLGTADLTAEDIFNAISTSTNPVAVRLKNLATVDSTGDQLAAFNII